MVNCCVNPACRTEFRLLDDGDVYAIGRPSSESEFFWMCANCASRFDLSLDASGNLALTRKGDSDQSHPLQRQARLRLVAHTRRHMPWRNGFPAGAGPRVGTSGNWGAPAHGAHH